MLFYNSSPGRIVTQILDCHSLEQPNPTLETTVVSINVLVLERANDTPVLLGIYRLMGDMTLFVKAFVDTSSTAGQ